MRSTFESSQPWLNRNELTDLLSAGEDEGGDAYALACLLGLNGLRISEACGADVTDLAGSLYQPTLRIIGKGDKPAEVVLNPRTQQAVDEAVAGRTAGPLLRNQWRRRMQPHNAAAVRRRLARTAGITQRVTPHALRRSYITVGLLQGVPLCDMQRAARHTKADTTVGYDQSGPILPPRPDLRPHGRHRAVTVRGQPLPDAFRRCRAGHRDDHHDMDGSLLRWWRRTFGRAVNGASTSHAYPTTSSAPPRAPGDIGAGVNSGVPGAGQV